MIRRANQLGIGAILLLGALSGCASIVNGRHAEVAFDSCPANAHVVVRDKQGRKVAALETPGVVSLKRNRRFFMPAYYTAIIESPGYAPAEVPLRSTINPWILGNVIVGGVPGLVVDAATGAAWKPRRVLIQEALVPYQGPNSGDPNSIGAALRESPAGEERFADRAADSPGNLK